MSKFKVGEKVHVVRNLREISSIFAIFTPPTMGRLLGTTVTIADIPDPEVEFYNIKEDKGRYIYSGDYFRKIPDRKAAEKKPHRWTETELDEARQLICLLLLMREPDGAADVSYRFIDLVTPYKTGKLKHGAPRILLLRSTLFGSDIQVFTGTADEHDEPNTTIGTLVCLCKAKGVMIPDWVMRSKIKQEAS